jgi:glyoxylase-like metal-dependent hydrolase (beta-lactamase superfamily II)
MSMSSDAAEGGSSRFYNVACHGGPFAALPDSARGRQAGLEGYVIEEIKPGIFWLSTGGYDTMFLTTGEGVIVIDAPPALRDVILSVISSKTSEPITHVIYSHSHFDHIGAADIYPANAVRIAQRHTADTLARYRDPRRPPPTLTVDDGYLLELGSKQLALRYHGNVHQPGNLFIHEPRNKVLMLVDVIFPGWVPFRNLANANDVHEFIRAHDVVMTYDFDVLVCGHLTRTGTRVDVQTQREYVHALREAAKIALASVRIEEIGERTGFENVWALMDGYIDELIERVALEVLSAPTSNGHPWTERLGGADVWTRHNAFAMIHALRVENTW